MTLRRASLALSLVAVAAPAAASLSQSAPPPAGAPAATVAPAQPPATTPAPKAPSSTAAAPVDPRAIAFDVSADHMAEDSSGPKLLKYVIDFVPASGASGQSYSIDLGKPKAVAGSVITVPLTKLLLPGTYMAHVRAIGRGVQTATTTVGPFVITEKSAKTKAEYDKEMRDRQNKKSKAPPSNDSGTEGQDGSKPGGKGGFWKKFYDKVVG